MKFDTQFNTGDTVYIVTKDYNWEKHHVCGPLTINYINVEINQGVITEIYACEETDEAYLREQVYYDKQEAIESMNRLNRKAALLH